MKATAEQANIIANELATANPGFSPIKGYFALALQQVADCTDLPSVWAATQNIINDAADKALRHEREIIEMIGERIWNKNN